MTDINSLNQFSNENFLISQKRKNGVNLAFSVMRNIFQLVLPTRRVKVL